MFNSKSGLIISDTRISAISTSSRIWADKLNAEIIYALEFPTLAKLIQVVNQNYDWVLFTWRGSLEVILKDRILTCSLNKACKEKVLLFSVPDHIDLSVEGGVNANPIYFYADSFTVVSRRLQSSYVNSQSIAESPLYLPDFPNISLLEDVRKMNLPKVPNSVIWIGNSRWGNNLGFHDHKGYVSKFKRIIDISVARSIPLSFKVIDRGKAYLPHRATLIELAKSTFLLQTSASEGTGLPVLEALALGTYPISTDVGINREVFGDRWIEFYGSSPQEFLDKIQSSSLAIDTSNLHDFFNLYVEKCSEHIANFEFPEKDSSGRVDANREKYLTEIGIDFRGRLRWSVRFLLHQVRTIAATLRQESRE